MSTACYRYIARFIRVCLFMLRSSDFNRITATGIINDVSDTDNMARAVSDTDGVYFVPAFSGLQVRLNYVNSFSSVINSCNKICLNIYIYMSNYTRCLSLQAPINNPAAAAGFVGIKPTTQKEHIVRSLLESLVFRIQMLYECLCKETSFTYRSIK